MDGKSLPVSGFLIYIHTHRYICMYKMVRQFFLLSFDVSITEYVDVTCNKICCFETLIPEASYCTSKFKMLIASRGCACDIPSVTYQYTWEPAIWSKYYSEAPEIFQYFKNVVKKYNLQSNIKLLHCVDHAEWNEEDGKWIVSVTDLEKGKKIEDHCDIFINAMGFLKYGLMSQIALVSC